MLLDIYKNMSNAIANTQNGFEKRVQTRYYRDLRAKGSTIMNNVSIIIVSYNNKYLMQKCIESIRTTCLDGTYEIIVVDNASTDGVREWLVLQEDIKVILLDENVGFPAGCNIGALYAEPGNDIFLLNNDTRLCENALLLMASALDKNPKAGAVGAMSNYAGNNQQLEVMFQTPSEYVSFGNVYNETEAKFYEKRVRLSAFAMLIRREAWERVEGFDEQFSPGYFDDDDLSMKIAKEGYELLLCRNVFIYHAGSQSFAQKEGIESLLLEHQELFLRKYGFDIMSEARVDYSILSGFPFNRDEAFNVLIIGGGLGTEALLIKSYYPNANILMVDNRNEIVQVAVGNLMIVDELEKLENVFAGPVFNYLFVTDYGRQMLAGSQADISKYCLPQCAILPRMNEENVPFDKIKLVIWDLDNTFWSGILSEGEVIPVYEAMEAVKNLTDCGIVNSISSKNQKAEVDALLTKLNLADYFVFNDINWSDKGAVIKEKIKDMGLRAENVLFIDDETHNLEAALFENPGLMVASPDIIPKLYQYCLTAAKIDVMHERLHQYKILENKRTAKVGFKSSKDFLRYSEIEIAIETVTSENSKRVLELINRTNQLNYTKCRETEDSLKQLLQLEDYDIGLVRVNDKFGDYGVVGFWAMDLNNRKLKHFLFSCRVIGMGIPAYIYEQLGRPSIDIIGPIAENIVQTEMIDWISLNTEARGGVKTDADKNRKIKILLKGPCDMSAIESYLIGGDIEKEFNHINDKGFVTTGQNHSMHIWESAHLSADEISEVLDEAHFLNKDDFLTTLFDKEYHVICYSLLQDCHAGLYKNKKSGQYIAFGGKNYDITNPLNWTGYMDGTISNHGYSFAKEELEQFAANWEFVTCTPIDMLLRNLDYIYDNVPGKPVIVLLLGCEMKCEKENPEYKGFERWHHEVNEAIREFAKDRDRIRLVDVNDYIHSQEDFADSINHYSRNVYYDISSEIVKIINEKVDDIINEQNS